MPAFDITTHHELGQQEAKERLNAFIAKVAERFPSQVSNLQQTWNDNTLLYSFTTFGFNVRGSAIVEADQVRLRGDLPLAAMMFKGKIEQSIRDEVAKLLA